MVHRDTSNGRFGRPIALRHLHVLPHRRLFLSPERLASTGFSITQCHANESRLKSVKHPSCERSGILQSTSRTTATEPICTAARFLRMYVHFKACVTPGRPMNEEKTHRVRRLRGNATEHFVPPCVCPYVFNREERSIHSSCAATHFPRSIYFILVFFYLLGWN